MLLLSLVAIGYWLLYFGQSSKYTGQSLRVSLQIGAVIQLINETICIYKYIKCIEYNSNENVLHVLNMYTWYTG